MAEGADSRVDASRSRFIQHEDLEIPIGGHALLAIKGETGRKARLTSFFVGQENGEYVILRLTRHLYQHLMLTNTEVTVRYMLDNIMVGFASRVHSVITKPFPLLFLDYPKGVELLNLRQEERVPCIPPIEVAWSGSDTEAGLLDLSACGCRFVAKEGDEDKLKALREGDEIFCRINMAGLDAEIAVNCLVRTISHGIDRCAVGVEFLDLPENQQLTLKKYVQNTKKFWPV